MQTVGEKLKQARLQQNLSFDETYKQTKIHTHVLEALEQDRAHNFLSFVYIKGFLKKYAQFLGLDSQQLIKEYVDNQRLTPPAASKEETVQKEKKETKEKKEIILPQINPVWVLRIVLAVLVAWGLVAYLRHVARAITRHEKSAKAPLVKVEVLPVVPETKKEKAVPIPAPKLAQTEEGLTLEVKTKEDCWVKVEADGQVVFAKILPKGKVEQWLAKESLELRLGKPEAVEIWCNGVLVDLKKENVKKGLRLSQKGIQGK